MNARARSGKRKKAEGNRGGDSPARGYSDQQSSILDFCNAPLSIENWQMECLRFLRLEGVLLGSQKNDPALLNEFRFKGKKITFGNIDFLQGRLRSLFFQMAREGKFPQNQAELINATLGETGGLRFRLEKIIPARREERETVSLNPKTSDLNLLIYFAAARFISGLDPAWLALCPNCEALFQQKTGKRRRFCSDGCRTRYHNNIRVDSGRQALYMRRRRQKLKEKEGSTAL